MTTPRTTEIPQRLAPVTKDPFIDDLTLPSRPDPGPPADRDARGRHA